MLSEPLGSSGLGLVFGLLTFTVMKILVNASTPSEPVPNDKVNFLITLLSGSGNILLSTIDLTLSGSTVSILVIISSVILTIKLSPPTQEIFIFFPTNRDFMSASVGSVGYVNVVIVVAVPAKGFNTLIVLACESSTNGITVPLYVNESL